MKHLVLIGFIDKESGAYLASGSFYESNNFERVMKIERLGFIKANQNVLTLEVREEKKTVKRTRKKASDVDVRES